MMPEAWLDREHARLRQLLEDGEKLLEARPVGLGFHPGLLAVTDRRLLHLYFRRLVRRMKVTEMRYQRLNWVELHRWRRCVEFRASIDLGDGGIKWYYLPVHKDADAAPLLDAIRAACPRLVA